MSEQKIDNTYDLVRIKALPKGKPNANEHFEMIKGEKLDLDLGANSGKILIEPVYISVDPYLRLAVGQFFNSPDKQYSSFGVAKILKSENEKYKPGDLITGEFKWSSKSIIDPNKEQRVAITQIPPDLSQYKPEESDDFDVNTLKDKIPTSYYIGAYGMPGQTAYYGLITKGRIKKGENVLITGAAGAVGSVVGQIAKNVYGCYVVGVAGSSEKVKWMTEDLGFDAAINYKEYGDDYNKVQAILKEKCPNGIDIYFDNVGGIFTDSVWDLLNPHGRVIVCGQIASYNDAEDNVKLIRPVLPKLIYNEVEVLGLSWWNFKDFDKFYYEMGKWIVSGKVKVKQTVVDGFEKVAEAYCALFTGSNIGKMMVKCT